MTTTQDRAKQCMKNMLAAFAKSEHHRDSLNTALEQFGFQKVSDVTDEKLFDVCEVARGLAGMPTGFMFASAKADALGLAKTEKPETVAETIESMAREHYAMVDANDLTPAFEGSKADISADKIYDWMNAKSLRGLESKKTEGRRNGDSKVL